jgi:hypothetical protein
LLEAIVYCIVCGFSEDYVMDLDVYGFGQIYKYLKRIETRKNIGDAGLFRTAMNASKKEYKEFIKAINIWLPDAEKQLDTGTQQEFNDLVAKGKI